MRDSSSINFLYHFRPVALAMWQSPLPRFLNPLLKLCPQHTLSRHSTLKYHLKSDSTSDQIQPQRTFNHKQISNSNSNSNVPAVLTDEASYEDLGALHKHPRFKAAAAALLQEAQGPDMLPYKYFDPDGEDAGTLEVEPSDATSTSLLHLPPLKGADDAVDGGKEYSPHSIAQPRWQPVGGGVIAQKKKPARAGGKGAGAVTLQLPMLARTVVAPRGCYWFPKANAASAPITSAQGNVPQRSKAEQNLLSKA